YDAQKNTFATTFAEISVGCEACHGKGSAHVAWARDRNAGLAANPDDPSKGLAVLFDERRQAADWTPDPATGSPVEGRPLPSLRKEVETCGLCHERRSTIAEDWTPGHWLSDTQIVSGLREGLYFLDGQMRDEVYTYGTFKQSKMFAKGVTCSDCHDPHSGKLAAPADGLCLACHAGATYATPAHSHHADVAPAPGCPACHMPTRVYMVDDPRHDHGFRIPRPDLSVRFGTPNACNACHTDKSPQWAAEAIKAWGGSDRPGFQDYALAFHDAWEKAPHAEALLAKIAADPQVPAFARSSALGALAPYLSPNLLGLVRSGLADPDPMVRIGALDMLEGAPTAAIWPLAAPLLVDPVRGVRLRAVDLLAAVASARQPAADRAAFERAAREFVEAQNLNADRPDARVALGAFYARRGNAAEAEREFRTALQLVPQFAPAAIHLADLYRQMGRDADGVAVLSATIAVEPAAANLRHALGLALIRVRQSPEALVQLGEAVALDRTNETYVYAYAIALNAAGQSGEARAVLDGALARWPGSRRILSALVAISRDANDLPAALAYAERLAKLYPDDREIARFIEGVRGTVH
ncbi:MAG: cytochrome c3 family protein, partial [Ancalomicrobiaceae bacterium]|nr:cytochrome c3 family protein [Ancalomicrobiaceae bacterium]